MDYGYEPVSNIERNKRGLFELKVRDSSYYSKNLNRVDSMPNDMPVWALPDMQHSKINKDPKTVCEWQLK